MGRAIQLDPKARMTREELIRELRKCEDLIEAANVLFQGGRGARPSVAVPEICARRKELRERLIHHWYEGGTPYEKNPYEGK